MATPPPLSNVQDAGIPDRISAGVAAGIITPDQALALRQLPLDSTPERFTTTQTGDEPFALFRGFRDVFLTLGIIVLGIGLGGVASEAFGLRFDGVLTWNDVGLAGALAAIAWAVAEWVTGRLRMPLASLVTAIAFSSALMVTVIMILGNLGLIDVESDGAGRLGLALLAASAALFYVRFRLPFALALIAGSVGILVFQMLDHQGRGAADISVQIYAGLLGALTFASAMVYELRDQRRETRLAENAFWLHLVAAPLIVFALTGGLDAMDIGSTGDAVRIFVVVALLGLIALLIDRRAFIVSALLYLAGAIAYTISQSGLPSNLQFAVTALVLGLFVVGLALGWQPLRQAFLRVLPAALASRLPRPVGPDGLGG